MADTTLLAPPTVTRPLAQVRRRLFFQNFMDLLVWCWSGAMVLSAGWFVVQPLLWETAPDWLRWSVGGSLLGVATVLAGVLAWLRAPSKAAVALALDEKFGLKERVTTLLLLPPEQTETPAAQALRDDVQQRVGQLDVPSRFPLHLSRSAVLVPLCALLFAGVVFFYEPPKGQAVATKPEETLSPVKVEAIEKKMQQLKRKPATRPAAEPRSEKLEELEAKLEDIAKRPPKTKEELRERVKEMKSLEDSMQKREQELADKMRNLKKQLSKLDQNEEMKEGPGKDLQKALSDGNMEKAKEELKNLAEKMQKNELSDKDKQQLAKQLKDVEDKMKRLAELKDKQEQLEQLKKDGKLDKETYENEKNRLQKESQKLQDLKELADKMGDIQKALEQGDGKSAEQKMKEAGEKLKEMGMDEKELEDLQKDIEKLKDAKDSLSKELQQGKDKQQGKQGGQGEKQGDKDKQDGQGDQQNGQGEQEGKQGGQGEQEGGQGEKQGGQGDGQEGEQGQGIQSSKGGEGVGAGRRPLGKDGSTKSFDAKGKPPFDPKGKKILEGYAPGQNFKKKTSAEMAGEVQQSSQEAAEAMEQQRIPRDARKMAKGYFQNLSGAKEKEKKEKKD